MTEQGLLPNHLRALGFNRNPFPQTPDADCYFRTEQIAQYSLEAFHCLKAGKGFVLLTGEVGTGKSTFLRCLMDELHTADCAVSFVFNTFLQGRNLLLALNRDFGIEAGADFAEDIELLNQYLIEQYAQGRCCVLVIDDAQNLDKESLELLRLLSNLETRQNKLLQIVLSGQPELLDILEKKEIRQLTSRIMQHIQLWPFDRSECARYVNFRISKAGADGRISLSPWANLALHWYSKGNPRRIHTIMDRCLYGIAPDTQQEISVGLIRAGVREGGVAHRFPYRTAFASFALLSLGIVSFSWWLATGQSSQANANQVAQASQATPKLNSPAKANAVVHPSSSQGSTVESTDAKVALAATVNAEENKVKLCLKQYAAEFLYAELNDGLDVVKRQTVMSGLAKRGLALAFLPAGLRLPETSASQNHCTAIGKTGSWVLWKPKYLPFELTRNTDAARIEWLQTRLASNRLYSADIDGLFGPKTTNALHQFQRWHGLTADNLIDPWALFLLEHDLGNVTS
ncbi:ExeA family protein [Undibacterium fentianense]|uniref:AAA family ATPase n=1 Tax=Undibacterium fentianense TaxID=2828728 RepID=A0A941E3J7_9BURK|nr:ExeA family protein [Undibacterium fentianense]MBR7800856.1 AAA family ATPase [Undibacterium fentianense]